MGNGIATLRGLAATSGSSFVPEDEIKGLVNAEDGSATELGRAKKRKPLSFERQQDLQDKLAKAVNAHYKGSLTDDLSVIIDPAENDEGLFLSAMKTAVDGALLNRAGITHVLNVSGEDTTEQLRKSGFKGQILVLKISDNENFPIEMFFKEAFEFMRKPLERGEKPCTLVHCQLGVSRSPTVVLAYLMYHRGMNLWQAADVTARARGIIYPNEGFLEALVTLAHTYNKL